MISYLEGTIKFKDINSLTLLVCGVGYKVYVPNDILNSVNPENKISFYIHSHIKEDAFDLYGFNDLESIRMFELLLTVSGVGPKTALGVFSVGKLAKIKAAIVKGDVEFFMSVPRLGRKNAQKIIIELRSKLGSLENLDLTAESGESREVIEALKSFGFTTYEAKEALKSVGNLECNTSEKIREALKYLGKIK